MNEKVIGLQSRTFRNTFGPACDSTTHQQGSSYQYRGCLLTTYKIISVRLLTPKYLIQLGVLLVMGLSFYEALFHCSDIDQ